jgi:hypothetical protein
MKCRDLATNRIRCNFPNLKGHWQDNLTSSHFTEVYRQILIYNSFDDGFEFVQIFELERGPAWCARVQIPLALGHGAESFTTALIHLLLH